jgi:hypothetical protein
LTLRAWLSPKLDTDLMSAGDDLDHAYSEWRRLAEAEGKAIRAGDWGFVADCQKALRNLQSVIDRLSNSNREESPLKESSISVRRLPSRASVLELIELQRQNLATLQQRRERLSAHVEQLSRTVRNLRGLQRSYASPPPAAWNSFS